MSDDCFKRAVQHRFDRAAPSYDALADIQRQAAQRLLTRLPSICPAGPWLDAGCGTGFALPHLARHTTPPLIALDLAFGMAQAARAHNAHCLVGDIEQLPLADQSIAVYWSNLAWQWCTLTRALHEAHRVLKLGGQLVLGTLGPRTLWELRDAFSGLDNARHVIDFTAPEILHCTAHAIGFQDIQIERHTLTAWQPDVAHILRGLKNLGAGEVGAQRRRGLLGKSVWQQIEQRYETHRSPNGLPVTYDFMMLTCRLDVLQRRI